MREKALNRKHSLDTKNKISQSNGQFVNVYEKNNLGEFNVKPDYKFISASPFPFYKGNWSDLPPRKRAGRLEKLVFF